MHALYAVEGGFADACARRGPRETLDSWLAFDVKILKEILMTQCLTSTEAPDYYLSGLLCSSVTELQ